MAEAYNASGHSVFGPSSSAMWLYCAKSLIANMLEPDRSSFEAVEGTVAHGIAEQWQKSGKRPKHLIGTTIEHVENGETFYVEVTHSMMDFIEEYVDWCRDLDGDHYVETRVWFSEYTPIPNQGGTADHAACCPGKLVITDFKYGKGVDVHAEGNTQGLMYALGFFLLYDAQYHFEEIVIRICQPRLGIYETWTVSREYLLEFAEFLRERAAKAWNLNAPMRVTPKGCMWCKIKGRCPAMLRTMDALVEGRFADLDKEYSSEEIADLLASFENGKYRVTPMSTDRLTPKQMAKILPYRRLIESFFKSLDEHAERLALQGTEIPGHKLVESRSYRSFKNEDRAAETLRLIGLDDGEIFETSMRSPAQIEEAIREKFPHYPKKFIPLLIESDIDRPRGRPTLVLLSDKRPVFNGEFDDMALDDSDDYDYDDL